MSEAIGVCLAVIDKIATTKDGGYKITLEIGADETETVQQLIKRFGINEKQLSVGFATHDG